VPDTASDEKSAGYAALAGRKCDEHSPSLSNVFQIIFNEISAAEISQLPTLTQLELLSQFKVSPEDLENLESGRDDERFGRIERDGLTLYRFRASDLRIYFEVADEGVIVHRVLNKNTFQDFFYRAELPVSEDEALKESKTFWELIEEGQKARRKM
jgi:hypothetical protein